MKLRRIFAVLALFAVPLAACGEDQDPAVTGERPTTTEAGDNGDDIPAFTITADDYSFDVPADLTGGIVEITLDNQGEELHEAFFLGVADGTTLDEVIDAFGTVFEGGPIPDEWEVATGVGEVEPGESVTSTMTLPEGEYFLICTIPEGTVSWDDEATPDDGQAEGENGTGEGEAQDDGDEGDEGEPPRMHVELGMHETVEITETNDLELPELDGRVTIRDYDFDLPDLASGIQELTALNEGDENHHVLFFEWPEEVDSEEAADEAFQAMMEADNGPPPEGTPEPDFGGGSMVFSSGQGGSFEITFQSGHWYTAICFIQDREGGPPHAFAHEMYQHFLVD